jgi:hypothetical protein
MTSVVRFDLYFHVPLCGFGVANQQDALTYHGKRIGTYHLQSPLPSDPQPLWPWRRGRTIGAHQNKTGADALFYPSCVHIELKYDLHVEIVDAYAMGAGLLQAWFRTLDYQDRPPEAGYRRVLNLSIAHGYGDPLSPLDFDGFPVDIGDQREAEYILDFLAAFPVPGHSLHDGELRYYWSRSIDTDTKRTSSPEFARRRSTQLERLHSCIGRYCRVAEEKDPQADAPGVLDEMGTVVNQIAEAIAGYCHPNAELPKHYRNKLLKLHGLTSSDNTPQAWVLLRYGLAACPVAQQELLDDVLQTIKARNALVHEIQDLLEHKLVPSRRTVATPEAAEKAVETAKELIRFARESIGMPL